MENLYLAHHGVKGMRWGVRRYQNYDGSLIGAKNKTRNSLDRYNKTKDDYKTAKKTRNGAFQLSDKQKKALKIGAIAIGTALATYGAIKLNESITQKAISQGGKKFVMSSLDRKTLRNQYIKSSVRDIKQKTFDTIERAASNAKDTATKIKSNANFAKRYTDTATRASYGKKFVLTPEQRAKARRDYAKYVLPNKFNPRKALDKAPRGPYREGNNSFLNSGGSYYTPQEIRRIEDRYNKIQSLPTKERKAIERSVSRHLKKLNKNQEVADSFSRRLKSKAEERQRKIAEAWEREEKDFRRYSKR